MPYLTADRKGRLYRRNGPRPSYKRRECGRGAYELYHGDIIVCALLLHGCVPTHHARRMTQCWSKDLSMGSADKTVFFKGASGYVVCRAYVALGVAGLSPNHGYCGKNLQKAQCDVRALEVKLRLVERNISAHPMGWKSDSAYVVEEIADLHADKKRLEDGIQQNVARLLSAAWGACRSPYVVRRMLSPRQPLNQD